MPDNPLAANELSGQPLGVICRQLEVEQKAFQSVTGLSLVFTTCDGLRPPWQNRFCEFVNKTTDGSLACRHFCRTMKGRLAAGSVTQQVQCFAGLMHITAKITVGEKQGGYLWICPIHTQHPDPAVAKRVLTSVKPLRLHEPAEMMRAYLGIPQVPPERAKSIAHLLDLIACSIPRRAAEAAVSARHDPRLRRIGEPVAITLARRAEEYIRMHFQQPITSGDVARQTRASEAHLCRQFKKATGQTLGGYIMQCRLGAARAVLRKASGNITTAMEMSGFGSVSQFYAAFKKHIGVTPGQFQHSSETQSAEAE